MSLRTLFPLMVLLAGPAVSLAMASAPGGAIAEKEIRDAIRALVDSHGETHRDRIERGVRQVAERWREEDGDAGTFRSFVAGQFIAEPGELAVTFRRISDALEQVDGHLHEVRRDLTGPMELDTGPVGKADSLLANLDLATSVDDALYRTKVAFLALLNFPVHTLDDRLRSGPGWDRETWARSRLMDRFAARVPAEVSQGVSEAITAASRYIDEYDIRMDRLVCPGGEPVFPEGLSLITHWGLRDELKSHYGQGEEGLQKQRTILKVMERIVRQEIPEAVRGNGDLLWCPETNAVRTVSGGRVGAGVAARESDTRYVRILETYRAVREADTYVPTASTFPKRRFELDRQIPEAEVEALLVSVMESPEVKRLAGIVRERLGRPLEPFDIWYAGFQPRSGRSEEQLDAIVRKKYPTVASFQEGLPAILTGLGFSQAKAAYLSERIVVDPSRGAGHAAGAVRREDNAHLRTRIPAGGMLYKGYNIAVHELGHNVEQVFSLNGVDWWTLSGVPNNAFTEALAFTFQKRDLELLGLGGLSQENRDLEALSTLWSAYEISGVSLVDMKVWRWLYEHPDASPAQLREATLTIAREVWNRWYAPAIGVKDSEILAIYSHMVAYPLYLADYAVGHLIAFQLGEKLSGESFGKEFERVSRQGRLTPDAWMKGAVGSPISAEALLSAARRAMGD